MVVGHMTSIDGWPILITQCMTSIVSIQLRV